MNIENPRSKVGELPGSITYTGENISDKIKIELITYDAGNFEKVEIYDIDNLDLKKNNKLKWLKVIGLNNTKIIKKLGEKLELNDLILEDIVNTNHTPKVEFHNKCLFLILKILYFNKKEMCVNIEHVSFLLFDDLVVSFQEYENNVFDYREKILKEGISVIRKRDIDYLLYSLVDSVIDEYFLVIEVMEEMIEELEIDILDNYNKENIYTVYNLRKGLSSLKRIIWPIEGAIKLIIREEDRIDEKNIKYFKEINDNLIQLMDFINMDREVILGIFDLYLSNNDNKMNKAMQTLTVVATIFTPMTFITGVYGMNFDYMPELRFKWSYPIFWIVAITNIVILYRYYKKKGWI